MLQWYLIKVVVHISKSFSCWSSMMSKDRDFSLRMLGILKTWSVDRNTWLLICAFSFLEMLWHYCDTCWFNSRRGDLKP